MDHPPPKLRRRAISLRGTTYKRLKAYTDAKGATIAGTLEMWIAEILDREEEKLRNTPPAKAPDPEVAAPRVLEPRGGGVVEF